MGYSVKYIIDKFGGIKKLATALNKDPATIYRWNYDKNKGGTGGVIPTSALASINEAAAALNIDLNHSEHTPITSTSTVHPHQFIHWFRNTAPYIHAHRGKTFVICFNGEAIEDSGFTDFIQDISLLHSLSIKLVLVHGIRPQLNKMLAEKKHNTHVIKHLRVTDKTTLKLAKQAVGSVRTDIEAQLSAGLALTSREGEKVRVSSGNVITAKPIGVIDGVDFQFTGEVRRVDIEDIRDRLDENNIVLVSPLGFSPTSEVFNLRCEEIATAIASNIEADKLILLTEGTDLIQGDDQVIRQLTTQQAEILANQSSKLSEMCDARLHLQEAISASKSGVHRVHLIDRKLNGGLLIELFTRHGSGTLISAQPFEDARAATVDDINGIIELIKPLEKHGLLKPRSPEVIELDINKFYIIKQDGLVTTCAALYSYPEAKIGELACVAVHPDYRTGERGEYLLQMIENKARNAGLTRIFVLTTQSSHWFLERGFKVAARSDLPAEKKAHYNESRRSQVLIKTLI